MRCLFVALALVVVVVVSPLCAAFYLPGVVPKDFAQGEQVLLKVNKLDSVKTQLPYDYYSLPFCRPPVIQEENESLGEILAGDRIETSLYRLHVRVDQACRILCRHAYSEDELHIFADKIEDGYRVNWIVDNLPAVTKYFSAAAPGSVAAADAADAGGDDGAGAGGTAELVAHYELGFDLGFVGGPETTFTQTEDGVKYINNHVRIVLFYHEDVTSFQGSRIVGFEVEPFSVRHEVDGDWRMEETKLKTCSALSPVVHGAKPQPVSAPGDKKLSEAERTIVWTYDVHWMSSNIKWAVRWDIYLQMTDSQIHWFSIINSIMIVLFLTGMIAMIMLRTLHRDLLAYNEDQNSEEQVEETGWKLLHGDVFRPPARGAFFSVLVGSGMQVFAMTLLTLIFAVLGFLSPANRGGLMTALLLLFVFMGVFAGYYSTVTYKMFKLTEWKQNTFWTAVFFPGICFAVFFLLNLLVWSKQSSGAVPFGTLVALLVLWFGISVPLVYVGSYFAFKQPPHQPPVSVNHIPRMVPPQAWFMHPYISVLIGGVLPFGAVFIEIFFIMSSVWLHQFYYVFGFLFIVFVVLIITCAEITIVMCYFQLCGEDYHWWWRSFYTSGSSALYLFGYSALYWSTKLDVVKLVPALLYFGYMLLVSFAFFLLTGTIGHFATYWFVHKIYSSIKIE